MLVRYLLCKGCMARCNHADTVFPFSGVTYTVLWEIPISTGSHGSGTYNISHNMLDYDAFILIFHERGTNGVFYRMYINPKNNFSHELSYRISTSVIYRQVTFNVTTNTFVVGTGYTQGWTGNISNPIGASVNTINLVPYRLLGVKSEALLRFV